MLCSHKRGCHLSPCSPITMPLTTFPMLCLLFRDFFIPQLEGYISHSTSCPAHFRKDRSKVEGQLCQAASCSPRGDIAEFITETTTLLRKALCPLPGSWLQSSKWALPSGKNYTNVKESLENMKKVQEEKAPASQKDTVNMSPNFLQIFHSLHGLSLKTSIIIILHK